MCALFMNENNDVLNSAVDYNLLEQRFRRSRCGLHPRLLKDPRSLLPILSHYNHSHRIRVFLEQDQ